MILQQPIEDKDLNKSRTNHTDKAQLERTGNNTRAAGKNNPGVKTYRQEVKADIKQGMKNVSK